MDFEPSPTAAGFCAVVIVMMLAATSGRSDRTASAQFFQFGVFCVVLAVGIHLLFEQTNPFALLFLTSSAGFIELFFVGVGYGFLLRAGVEFVRSV